MKNFRAEFGKFISRGNMIDMAVGVIVGGAFTAIVNTLVKSVFTPLINALIYLICGRNTEVFNGLDVTLIPATYDEFGNVVKAATVLGISDFITAVINFIITALVLFFIVKTMNKIRSGAEVIKEKVKKD